MTSSKCLGKLILFSEMSQMTQKVYAILLHQVNLKNLQEMGISQLEKKRVVKLHLGSLTRSSFAQNATNIECHC